ncbi:MAG TPA: LemA family protein, partial [Burkholderiaceae bacterium]
MTSHWLFQLAVAAVLLFWIVGAYNRLLRLRQAIIAAWEQIVAALGKRSEAMAAVMDAVRDRLDGEAATLQALA